MNATTSTDRRTSPSRRDAIKRALAASGAAYVAPMILGSASPASAQAISGTTCVGCGQLQPFATCAPNCSCYGRASTSGLGCVQLNPVGGQCGGVPTTCNLDSECGPGELCVIACGVDNTNSGLGGMCHTCCAIVG
jgi:hypothetical protein